MSGARPQMAFQPPQAEPVTIEGPSGPLEAVVEEPAAGAHAEMGGRFAVVCHPHPLYGGTLTNKVVHSIARSFQELGVATIRFNFRGVGASAGVYDEGIGETADALAAVEWGHRRWPDRRLWLAGFSFGSYVAVRAAATAAPERLVTVAPPVARFDFDAVPVPRCPWLIVQGDADELVDVGSVRDRVRSLVPPPTLVVLPRVEHFFHGRLHELKAAILDWVRAGTAGGPAGR